MYDNDKVNFLFEQNQDHVDSTSFLANQVWTLEKIFVNELISTDRYRFYNEPPNQVYSTNDQSINIVIKRKPLYFIINNIFPSLILNCITLLAFALPFAQQIGLCISFFFKYSYIKTI